MNIFGIGYSIFTAVWMTIVTAETLCPMSATEWGTWFGAIGTVAAFFAAIGVAYWTWAKGQEAKLNEKEVLAQAILAITYDYRYQLSVEIRKIPRPAHPNNLVTQVDFSSLFATHLASLEQIPLHQQPTHEHVYALMTIKKNIEASRDWISFIADIFSRWDEQGQGYEFAELKREEILLVADGLVENASRMIRLLDRVPHVEPSYLENLRKFSRWSTGSV